MRRLIAVLVALVTTLGTVPALASQPVITETQDSQPETTTVASFDGHEVPIRFNVTSETTRAPTLLWGHGWSGSYGDATDALDFYTEHGYNVVAMDFRGHGQAREDSVARGHSPDYEIRDVRHVIDWIANRSWAEREADTAPDRATPDPVLGGLGVSYGGGFQLLTAIFDERIDAIAPEITWNSLPRILAPNDAIKSTWVDALYASGTAQANLAPFIHQGYWWATATNEIPDGQAPGEPDVAGPFTDASPSTYGAALDVPALLIQGMPDVLAPLNEAVANAKQIREQGGAEAKLVTHLGGHVLNTNGTLGADEIDVGIQAPAREGPCGDVDQLVLAWYDDHLKNAGDDGIPEVAIATADGNCLTGEDVEAAVLGESTPETVALGDVVLPQGVPVASGFVQAEQEAEVHSPIERTLVPEEDVETVAGVATLSGQITIRGTEAIVYLQLVRDTGEDKRVVHDQVMAMREEGPAESASFSVDLSGVGVEVGAGETLAIAFSTAHPVYGDNGNREPGAVGLENLRLDLPTVS